MHIPASTQNPDIRWVYRCDGMTVEPGAHKLTRDGCPVFVEPKAFAVLTVLLEQAGLVVEKNALLDAVWGHRNVTPSVLSRVIAQLRHALGDSARRPRYIATVHCLGYRFVAKVYRHEAHPNMETVSATKPVIMVAPPSSGVFVERRTRPERRVRIERRDE